jgi:hypothetical protein
MNTSFRTRYSVLSLTALLCAASPSIFGQNPSQAASFNDSVSIFRETTTSDWPALFLSPLPYDPQAQNLEGVTLSAIKQFGNVYAILSSTDENSIFRWENGRGTNFMVGNFGFSFDDGNHIFTFDAANEGYIYVDGTRILTEASLEALPRISIGAGSFTAVNAVLAGGTGVTASGLNAAAFGLGTSAAGNNQFVIGQYNAPVADSLFVVGNGTNAGALTNAFVVKRNGDTEIRGKLTAGNGASATGIGGLALGDSAIAGAGNYATAIGYSAHAYGLGAAAFGFSSIASGDQSFSAGSGSIANAYGSVALGVGAYAEAPNSSALGGGAYAYGDNSSAVGVGAVALGHQSFAAGPDSYANGFSSVALATGIANGNYSTAFPTAEANGHVSIAMGDGSRTEGFSSIAMGRDVVAQGLNQVVVGQLNVPSGTPHNNWSEVNAWNPNDEIFIVGNGVSDTSRSNALTVKKNAATGIGTGIVTTTASQTVVGKYNDTSQNRGEGLFIVGMGVGTGTTPRKNAIRVREDGTLLVRPAGDLSMGGFESGEQP